jgi:hypothetical protein
VPSPQMPAALRTCGGFDVNLVCHPVCKLGPALAKQDAALPVG